MIAFYKHQLLKFFVSMITFGFTMITLSTWALAFLNGGSVVVTINDYGEMYPELVMWIILVPIILAGTWYTYDSYMVYRKIWKRMILGKFAGKNTIEWLPGR